MPDRYTCKFIIQKNKACIRRALQRISFLVVRFTVEWKTLYLETDSVIFEICLCTIHVSRGSQTYISKIEMLSWVLPIMYIL